MGSPWYMHGSDARSKGKILYNYNIWYGLRNSKYVCNS